MSSGNGAKGRPDPGSRGDDLRAWERSFEISVAIFKIADRIPQDLGLRLSGQIRIAALSVTSFIAKAQSGNSPREYLRGLCLARSALNEVETNLGLCAELGYASEIEVMRIRNQIREVSRLTAGIMKKLRASLGDESLQALSDQIAALIPDGKGNAAGGRS